MINKEKYEYDGITYTIQSWHDDEYYNVQGFIGAEKATRKYSVSTGSGDEYNFFLQFGQTARDTLKSQVVKDIEEGITAKYKFKPNSIRK